MTREQWTQVDEYISDTLVAPDDALNAALAANAEGGLPAIDVAPNQGKLLELLVRMHGSKTVLEVGTLGGYSTIWLARALPPGGRLVTLEFDPHHADVARSNIARAGLADVVELRVGPAIETMPQLALEGQGPFDFIFIDADKTSYPEYFALALELSRPGTVILADNVVRNGGLGDPDSANALVRAVRRLHELVAAEPRVTATTIQTVGSKGYDGFLLALVTS
ncbi:MAG TPA: O-methyltransferase [Gaiellales bacterium]|jgi:predicted O-methyltransferase YrrM